MKKVTKHRIMALVIVLIFGLSTVAFVVAGLRGTDTTNQNSVKSLNSTIVDGEINTNTENIYIQNQFTFLRLYYRERNALYDYASGLPEVMTLPTGEIQLIVNMLVSNETKAEIVNLNGNFEIQSPTEQKIFDGLCQQLMFTPTDCLVGNFTGKSNSTAINPSK